MTQTEAPQHSLDAEQAGYKQSLGRRHVQMIAIGGAIGTGLFLGSASRLHNTGPALLFTYAFVGVIAYFLMRALGELVLHRATSGAFVSYMREFYGEKWAFVTGWMYWLNWALTGIAELSAVGLYVQFWFPTMPTWATVLIALAVVLVINLLSARAFGEFEFWAAIAKVGAIVIFLVVGLVVVIGGFSIGGHEAGFHNLWSNPGGFWPHTGDLNWYGPLLAMSGVVFAYAAIEMVGVAAGEMQDAKTEVPKAVNAVIFRIAIFYCGSILLLVSMLPTSEYKSGTSPFVTVFERLGLTWMSYADPDRAHHRRPVQPERRPVLDRAGAAQPGHEQAGAAVHAEDERPGVPWAGILMTSVVFVFGSLLNFLAPDAFEIALEAAAIGVLFTWATIFLCQLKLRRLTDRGVIPPSTFPMPGHPWTSIIGLVFLGLVVVGMAISGWQASPYLSHKVTFLVVVFGIPILAVALAIGWRLVKPAVIENTGDRLKAVWSDDGPDLRAGRHARRPRRGRARPGHRRAQPGGPELRRQLRA